MRVLISSLLILLVTVSVRADFKAGLEAYDRGDYGAALQQWLPIAERGDPNAQFNVGLLYASGKGLPLDHNLAAQWYRKAAEKGVAAAQYNLAVMYANGDGVPRDVREAANWLKKATDAGLPMARRNLASLYDSDALRNYNEARQAYQAAAEAGDPRAQFDLGLLYDLGRGGPKNYEEAAKWYRKAADQGYAPAMINLGILYYNASGVERDLVQAYAWFVRAKLAHEPRANELLDVTMNKLKPEQIQRGERVASDWHPKQPAASSQVDVASLQTKLFLKPVPSNAPEPPSAGRTGDADRRLPVESLPIADRIVAIGDVHGGVAELLPVLRSASLTDANGSWSGGRTHLVLTTERMDQRTADFLNTLEGQAETAGGGVHTVLSGGAIKIGDTLFVHDGQFSTAADVDAALSQHGVKRVVVGHGTSDGAIVPRFDGKVIMNDDPGGMGCLVIEYGKAFALYRGQGLELPANDGDMQRYRRQRVSALESR
jgi:TPR repeat protein